ncbi:MAG TPA: hypothetical protein VMZ50_13595 [Phycisphaerae bacterium]|nr:hypothetical protein [Phycisphaerae bacterium]
MLSDLAAAILERLPTEPVGLAIDEVAAELLGRRDPRGRGRIGQGFLEIAEAIGPLWRGRGDAEDLGRYGIVIYGLHRHQLAAAQALLAEPGESHGPSNE